MSISLGLRALALLAFVAASTAVIVHPELIGAQADTQTLQSVVALSRL